MQVVCAKVREGDKRIVRIKEGNPEGRHVVIVDDLVQSGGTLRECQVSTCQALITSLYLVTSTSMSRESPADLVMMANGYSFMTSFFSS
jgi:hypoxanthine-guanine phosphoribosyltransferase